MSWQVDPIFLDGWLHWHVEVAYLGSYINSASLTGDYCR
jgi:hypothetical protein